SQAQPNSANIKKDGIAYGSYLRNYADCEKRHKRRLGVRRSAHFVGWMRLCEARARFSNRGSYFAGVDAPLMRREILHLTFAPVGRQPTWRECLPIEAASPARRER